MRPLLTPFTPGIVAWFLLRGFVGAAVDQLRHLRRYHGR